MIIPQCTCANSQEKLLASQLDKLKPLLMENRLAQVDMLKTSEELELSGGKSASRDNSQV